MATKKDGKLTLKIASYNIAASRYNRELSGIVSDIQSSSADIVGIQEIDMYVNRTGRIDMLKELSERAGYPYSLFVRAIDFDGGEYGTAILSKYPIEKSQIIPLDNIPQTKEARSVGITQINVLGEAVCFLNTHISHTGLESRCVHFEHLARITEAMPSYIITGDFNTDDFENFSRFKGARTVNNAENYLPSFAPAEKAIDNIVMSGDWTWRDSALLPHKNSDHRLLFATLERNTK